MTDREKMLDKALTYIGRDGYYVCRTKLRLGAVYDWCAFAVSAIMKDCGFIGKYIKSVEGGAGSIPRASDGKYGTWFKKGTMPPQSGDLIFLRYADYPQQDKYFCDHIGIVEAVKGTEITTLEGNVDGYGYNWVPNRRWLIHVSTLPTLIVYSKTLLRVSEDRVPFDYHFPEIIVIARGAIIRQIHNMFAGLTMVYNFTSIGGRDQLLVDNGKWSRRKHSSHDLILDIPGRTLWRYLFGRREDAESRQRNRTENGTTYHRRP